MKNKNHPSETLPIDNDCQTGLPLFSGGVFYMEKDEIWKDIEGYEGYYQISNFGRVKSIRRLVRGTFGNLSVRKELMLVQSRDKGGYLKVRLSKENKKGSIMVHQQVAVSFLGHIPCGYSIQINHKDGNKSNNNVSNLEIVTQRYNIIDAYLKRKRTSEYVGVCKDGSRNKWTAAIWINGAPRTLGRFDNEIDAAKAYQEAFDKYVKSELLEKQNIKQNLIQYV